MPQAQKITHLDPGSALGANLSPTETARYTGELLESLRKIAASQGQGVLAHLLELARYEAHSLARPSATTPDCPDGGHSGRQAPVPAKP